MVRLAMDKGTAKNVGYTSTTGHITSPDNLAQDALGNIYVIEDWPNNDDKGGDIWFLRDTNNDGIAESLDHFMSLQVKGAENTGMIFNPANPTQFIINVQHPESTDIVDGQGDATWLFDLKDVLAPPCLDHDEYEDHDYKNHAYKDHAYKDHSYKRHRNKHEKGYGKKSEVKTCSNSNDSNFIKKLIKAGK